MKGLALHEGEDGGDREHPGRMAPWERLVVDAVGAVIEFWGFKLNHGRVWALLYLRGRAMPASEIQDATGLSKGAVSMIARELELWGVVRRARAPSPSDDAWRFLAETDFMAMIGRVIAEREARFVRRIAADLEEAEARARAEGGVPRPVLERLARMRALARATGFAVEAFIKTARLDVKGLASILAGPARAALRKVRP